MMLHPVVLAAAVLVACAGVDDRAAARRAELVAAALVGGLILERALAGVRAARDSATPPPLTFPVFHLARDVAWVVGHGRLDRHDASPAGPRDLGDSMRPRPERAAPTL